MNADLFKLKWFFLILFEKGMGTHSSIWEGMTTNLPFYLEGVATNLLVNLEGMGIYLPFIWEGMAVD